MIGTGTQVPGTQVPVLMSVTWVPVRYPGGGTQYPFGFFYIMKSAKVWCSCIVYAYLK